MAAFSAKDRVPGDTLTAESRVLETRTSDISQLVEAKAVEDLPLGDQILVAYLRMKEGSDMDAKAIRRRLAERFGEPREITIAEAVEVVAAQVDAGRYLVRRADRINDGLHGRGGWRGRRRASALS